MSGVVMSGGCETWEKLVLAGMAGGSEEDNLRLGHMSLRDARIGESGPIPKAC